KAGISLRGRRLEQYGYLDEPDIREQLLDFTDGRRSDVHFYLPQIHCASCIWLLENLYRLHEGIERSVVNFPRKEVSLTFDESQISLRQVAELLASIGYAPLIQLSDLKDKNEERPVVDRSLYFQLGVAGFAFGNVMLLSFPEYLGLSDEAVNPLFVQWVGWLNIALSSLVVFYSGRDYLRSAWMELKHGHLNMDAPISLGILALYGRSLYEILTHTGAGYLDSLAGLLFFLLVGKWFQQRTYYRLSFDRDYRSYFPIAASVKEGEEEYSLSANKLEPGMTIVLRHGELIPADGILLRGDAQIDYSFVTGESEPVQKHTGDKLYAGGRQIGSTIEMTLTKKVSQSYLTSLWNEKAFDKEQESKTKHLADRIATYFTFTVLTLAFLTLAYWLPRDMSLAFNAFTAVLIVACPCAVALSVPFTFGNSLRLLAKKGFFLKNVHVLEQMSAVTAIVFDKTGTLTSREDAEVHFEGEKPLDEEAKKWLRSLSLQSVHPVSRQVNRWLGRGPLAKVRDFEELTGLGIKGEVEGHRIRLGSAEFLGVSGGKQARGLYAEVDGELIGHFVLENRLRPDLGDVLRKLKKKYKLYMLSGDDERERGKLEPLFGEGAELYFRQQPEDKLRFVEALQARGEKVLMLGDGLNDAGALKQSDVGIVLADDTNNFTPASDGIMDAGLLGQLPDFLRFAKQNLRLVYGAYLLALVYNIVGLSFAMRALLTPVIAAILMPASSVSIVLFGVLSSSFLAYKTGLFAEKAEKNDKNQ
ncbi:MAG TPA: heavy metal translocating P-type ATPase, partial [Phaeodactylibacter sp.]|nr:heavy metal translocating P-type ATPase [Phaeodactylibacter sp.]